MFYISVLLFYIAVLHLFYMSFLMFSYVLKSILLSRQTVDIKPIMNIDYHSTETNEHRLGTRMQSNSLFIPVFYTIDSISSDQ